MKVFKKIMLIFAATVFLVSAVTGTGLLIYVYKLSTELPSTADLSEFVYKQPTIILDRNGDVIAELGKERRYPILIEEMPEYLTQAIVAVEDARFYEHGGVDIMGIMRAFVTNIKAGKVVEGGSTLTQQLVKTIYLTPERKLKRKVKEAILAYKIDNNLPKEKILEIYLNQVYFGRGAYGVEAAAENYYGKTAAELSLTEAAMIAGLPKSPGAYAPHINPERAQSRRNHVLYRMYEAGYISETTAQEASAEPLNIIEKIKPKNREAGYFVDYVLKSLENEYQIEDPGNKGLTVYTTLDIEIQNYAEDAVRSNLIRQSKEIGYLETEGTFDPESFEDEAKMNEALTEELENIENYLSEFGYIRAYVIEAERNDVKFRLADGTEGTLNVKENRWAKKYGSGERRLTDFRTIIKQNDIILVEKSGDDDYRLAQDPGLESAALSINPNTGEIFAMVGGFDYRRSMFNRSVQAKRQVGSLFKPVVYSTAIESGLNVMTEIFDAPVIKEMDTKTGEYWKPKNDSGRYYGLTTLKEALTKSRNVVTIKVAEEIGIGRVLKAAQKFGIESELQRDLSTSIGSGSISLQEMVYAFSVFPNLGNRQEPYFITKIEDVNGVVIAEVEPAEPIEVIKPSTAHIMTDMMINVVENGTGRRAKKIKRILGGKTGTTNDSRDTWFIGYSPNFVNGIWVGFDDFKKIGERRFGSNTALPAWIDLTEKMIEKFPFKMFPVAKNVVYYKVDGVTNKITDSFADEYRFEPFETNSPVETDIIRE